MEPLYDFIYWIVSILELGVMHLYQFIFELVYGREIG